MSDVIKDKFYEALPYTILCHVETSSAVSMLHKKNQLYITSVPVTQGTSTEPILMIVHTINIIFTDSSSDTRVQNTEDTYDIIEEFWEVEFSPLLNGGDHTSKHLLLFGPFVL